VSEKQQAADRCRAARRDEQQRPKKVAVIEPSHGQHRGVEQEAHRSNSVQKPLFVDRVDLAHNSVFSESFGLIASCSFSSSHNTAMAIHSIALSNQLRTDLPSTDYFAAITNDVAVYEPVAASEPAGFALADGFGLHPHPEEHEADNRHDGEHKHGVDE
jgi:hypothetical protein